MRPVQVDGHQYHQELSGPARQVRFLGLLFFVRLFGGLAAREIIRTGEPFKRNTSATICGGRRKRQPPATTRTQKSCAPAFL